MMFSDATEAVCVWRRQLNGHEIIMAKVELPLLLYAVRQQTLLACLQGYAWQINAHTVCISREDKKLKRDYIGVVAHSSSPQLAAWLL